MTTTEVTNILRQFNEWRRGAEGLPPYRNDITEALDAAVEMIEQIEVVKKERDALRGKVAHMEKRLRLILEGPENTMSNSKAMREMIRQARLALGESK